MPTSENRSYAAYLGEGEDKDKIYVAPADKFEAENEERKEKGEEQIPALFMQSFVFPEAQTVADFSALVPSEAGQVNAFNAGYSVACGNMVRRLLTEKTNDGKPAFTEVQGHYDLSAKVAEALASVNKRLTPLEKAAKLLKESGVTAEQLQQLVASLASSAGQ